MSYVVEIERYAQKQLAKISMPFREHIYHRIISLKDNPRPPGCIQLKGRSSWRIRIGDYRVIYNIQDELLQVLVIDVDHRRQVYR